MQIGQQNVPRVPPRGAAAAIAVALVHIGIGWMLLTVHESAWRPHKPRPFQVVIVPNQTPRADASKPAKPRSREPAPQHADERSRKPTTAITYPPVPESVFDDAAARGALRNTPDCSAENLVHLAPAQREHCARMTGPVARGGDETDFLDPTLRAQFADGLARKGRLGVGPFHTCPPASRRALMGLACWKGMDN